MFNFYFTSQFWIRYCIEFKDLGSHFNRLVIYFEEKCFSVVSRTVLYVQVIAYCKSKEVKFAIDMYRYSSRVFFSLYSKNFRVTSIHRFYCFLSVSCVLISISTQLLFNLYTAFPFALVFVAFFLFYIYICIIFS